MFRAVLTAFAIAVSTAALAGDVLFPFTTVYGSDVACYRFLHGGRQAVQTDAPIDGEPALTGPIVLVDPFGLTAIEGGCEPLSINVGTSAMTCWSEGDEQPADAVFTAAADSLALTVKGGYFDGEYHLKACR